MQREVKLGAMSKKNRPAKAPVKIPAAAPQPVIHGDAFRTFLAEATSLGNEVAARRSFDRDVGEYLESKALTADFNAWREAKHSPPKV